MVGIGKTYIIRTQKKLFKFQEIVFATDIEIGADVQTMSAKIVANYGHFWITEDYLMYFVKI